MPPPGTIIKVKPFGALRNLNAAGVDSYQVCPVLVAHHLSASGVEGPAGLEAVDAPAGIGDVMAEAVVLPLPVVSFLVRPGGPFLRPDLPWRVTPRAAAVKDGRRSARCGERCGFQATP